jgi:hypothetical protein
VIIVSGPIVCNCCIYTIKMICVYPYNPFVVYLCLYIGFLDQVYSFFLDDYLVLPLWLEIWHTVYPSITSLACPCDHVS